jgi:hypothetical protein
MDPLSSVTIRCVPNPKAAESQSIAAATSRYRMAGTSLVRVELAFVRTTISNHPAPLIQSKCAKSVSNWPEVLVRIRQAKLPGAEL